MHPLINVGIKAARAAGKLVLRNFERADQIKADQKGLSDWVSDVDRGAEHEIIQTVRRYYPDHAILGEESGASGTSDWRWIIDPLDGTTNFLHRLPHFAVSIGVVQGNEVQHAIIYAPCSDELFTASRGHGTMMNNRRLRVSRTRQLGDSIIGTGFPIRKPEATEHYLPMFTKVVNDTAGVRRAGSAALDLAYVAAGRLDGFWELGLKPWDIAAGMLMVEEAGGIVSELNGRPNVLDTGDILAGNPRIHGQLEQLFRSE